MAEEKFHVHDPTAGNVYMVLLVGSLAIPTQSLQALPQPP
jgi:hypothetical protein